MGVEVADLVREGSTEMNDKMGDLLRQLGLSEPRSLGVPVSGVVSLADMLGIKSRKLHL